MYTYIRKYISTLTYIHTYIHTQQVSFRAVVATGLVKGAASMQATSPVASAALGRTMVCALMLAQGKKGHGQSATMIVIDIARLRQPAEFASDIDALSAAIKALPRIEGVDELRLPGERGARALKQARAQGIKIGAKVWDELVQVAEAYQVALPDMGDTK